MERLVHKRVILGIHQQNWKINNLCIRKHVHVRVCVCMCVCVCVCVCVGRGAACHQQLYRHQTLWSTQTLPYMPNTYNMYMALSGLSEVHVLYYIRSSSRSSARVHTQTTDTSPSQWRTPAHVYSKTHTHSTVTPYHLPSLRHARCTGAA